MVSTEITPKNLTLTSFKANFVSTYHANKSKTKAKPSDSKSPSLVKSEPAENKEIEIAKNCITEVIAVKQKEHTANSKTKPKLSGVKADAKFEPAAPKDNKELYELEDCSPSKDSLTRKLTVVQASKSIESSSTFKFFAECRKMKDHNYSGSDVAKSIKLGICNEVPWNVFESSTSCFKFTDESIPRLMSEKLAGRSQHKVIDLTSEFDLSGLYPSD